MRQGTNTRLQGVQDDQRISIVLDKRNRALEGWITVDRSPLI